MSRLGNSIVGGAQRLGHAVHKGVDSAVRLVDKVAPKVEAIAGKVANVAAVVGKVASAALPFTIKSYICRWIFCFSNAIEPIIKQRRKLHFKCNLYTILYKICTIDSI